MINFGEKEMKISICSNSGHLIKIEEAESHTKAINSFSVNPVKKTKGNDFDFITYTVEGAPERNYWKFK
jgi:hypothetical protein